MSVLFPLLPTFTSLIGTVFTTNLLIKISHIQGYTYALHPHTLPLYCSLLVLFNIPTSPRFPFTLLERANQSYGSSHTSQLSPQVLFLIPLSSVLTLCSLATQSSVFCPHSSVLIRLFSVFCPQSSVILSQTSFLCPHPRSQPPLSTSALTLCPLSIHLFSTSVSFLFLSTRSSAFTPHYSLLVPPPFPLSIHPSIHLSSNHFSLSLIQPFFFVPHPSISCLSLTYNPFLILSTFSVHMDFFVPSALFASFPLLLCFLPPFFCFVVLTLSPTLTRL